MYIENNKDFLIPGGRVHDLVEICPCIVAVKDLDNYKNDDFVPAFQQISLKVYSGDVIGIGTVRRFRAYYKADEVKKASSVITFQQRDDINRVTVELNNANIMVYLPPNQFKMYTEIGTSTKDQLTMLMGVLYVPVLTQAISEMDVDGESEFAEQAWYKSLMAVLDKLGEGDPDKLEKLIEKPFETAQRILGDNVSLALQILENRDW